MQGAILVEKRVAVALWHLATGDSYRTVGIVFRVGRCTAINLKDKFCSALLISAKKFIKFTKGEAETRRAVHIPIVVSNTDSKDYYNGNSSMTWFYKV